MAYISAARGGEFDIEFDRARGIEEHHLFAVDEAIGAGGLARSIELPYLVVFVSRIDSFRNQEVSPSHDSTFQPTDLFAAL